MSCRAVYVLVLLLIPVAAAQVSRADDETPTTDAKAAKHTNRLARLAQHRQMPIATLLHSTNRSADRFLFVHHHRV